MKKKGIEEMYAALEKEIGSRKKLPRPAYRPKREEVEDTFNNAQAMKAWGRGGVR